MSTQTAIPLDNSSSTTNGSGAAAVLSAGIGMFSVALLSIIADQSAIAKNLLAIYKPSGALSGVTTVAILIWLGAWVILDIRWRRRSVSLFRVNVLAAVLLGLSLLLTFPPVGDLF